MAYMEVLLREDIDNLGHRGEIVRVRRGYGRNYLLPHKLAVEASASNLGQIEAEKRVLAKREARERASAEQASKTFEGIALTFERRAGEEGRLFGSVTAIDIARALAEQGREVDRHHLRLKEPIKQIGTYEVPLRLHRDIVVTIQVTVTPEGGMPVPEAEAAPPPAEAAPEPAVEAVEADEDSDEYEDYEE